MFSAGTKPTHVRPEAIAVIEEIGVDISEQRSKSVDEFIGYTNSFAADLLSFRDSHGAVQHLPRIRIGFGQNVFLGQGGARLNKPYPGLY